MANLKASKKDIIRTERNRIRNQHYKSLVKTKIKNAVEAIDSNAENSKDLLRLAQKTLDQVAAKGIIHKNTAARKKSALMKRVAEQINPEQQVKPKLKKKTTK
jgi:small subunit ribosomal protein S20